MLIARFILTIIGLYSAVGIAFAVAFVTFGVGRVDPAARGARLGFRVLLLPGSAALWPALLFKWIATDRKPRSRT